MGNITHKYITVSYRLYTIDDDRKTLVEEINDAQAIRFMSGFGTMLPDFEKETEQLETGEEFNFMLTPDKAYGEYDMTHVIDVDKGIFTINNHFDHEHIYKGAVIRLQNEDGNYFMGKVMEIGEEKVKIDLNHPLAGKVLNFQGKVIESRTATDEEVKDFINRMNSHECGCGCGDCGGGCGGHDHEGGCGHHHEHEGGCGGHHHDHCGGHHGDGCCGHHH